MVLPVTLLLAAQLTLQPPASAPSAASDPPAQPSPITLSAAVAQAKIASPRRRAAGLAAEGARESMRFAGRMPNPLFELRSENWTTSNRVGVPETDLFAVATQPIELGGKRGIRQQLALAESGVADTALAAIVNELALDTARTYIRALKARASVETLTANRDGLRTLIAGVERRVDEGYTAEADLLKFKTEAARVDGEIARARLELDRSLTALSVTIGFTTPIEASQLIEPAPLDPPMVAGTALAAAVARHPAVVAASATVERARQLTAYERARRWPEALITAGYKRTAGFDTGVLGVSVVLPIFDRNDLAVTRTLTSERGAAADRDVLMFQLTADAAALIDAARTISERARLAPAELLAPAEDVRRAALASFREGTADVLKLIDAERVYADVRRVASELRLDALLTTIEARFALGEEGLP